MFFRLETSLTSEPISPAKYLEMDVFPKVLESLVNQAIYPSANGDSGITQIHHHIVDLEQLGILPHDCSLGRLPFLNTSFVRTAINVPLTHLEERRIPIMLYAMERNLKPEHLLFALQTASVLGTLNGKSDARAISVNRFIQRIPCLTPDMVNRLLISPHKVEKLLAAA